MMKIHFSVTLLLYFALSVVFGAPVNSDLNYAQFSNLNTVIAATQPGYTIQNPINPIVAVPSGGQTYNTASGGLVAAPINNVLNNPVYQTIPALSTAAAAVGTAPGPPSYAPGLSSIQPVFVPVQNLPVSVSHGSHVALPQPASNGLLPGYYQYAAPQIAATPPQSGAPPLTFSNFAVAALPSTQPASVAPLYVSPGLNAITPSVLSTSHKVINPISLATDLRSTELSASTISPLLAAMPSSSAPYSVPTTYTIQQQVTRPLFANYLSGSLQSPDIRTSHVSPDSKSPKLPQENPQSMKKEAMEELYKLLEFKSQMKYWEVIKHATFKLREIKGMKKIDENLEHKSNSLQLDNQLLIFWLNQLIEIYPNFRNNNLIEKAIFDLHKIKGVDYDPTCKYFCDKTKAHLNQVYAIRDQLYDILELDRNQYKEYMAYEKAINYVRVFRGLPTIDFMDVSSSNNQERMQTLFNFMRNELYKLFTSTRTNEQEKFFDCASKLTKELKDIKNVEKELEILPISDNYFFDFDMNSINDDDLDLKNSGIID